MTLVLTGLPFHTKPSFYVSFYDSPSSLHKKPWRIIFIIVNVVRHYHHKDGMRVIFMNGSLTHISQQRCWSMNHRAEWTVERVMSRYGCDCYRFNLCNYRSSNTQSFKRAHILAEEEKHTIVLKQHNTFQRLRSPSPICFTKPLRHFVIHLWHEDELKLEFYQSNKYHLLK